MSTTGVRTTATIVITLKVYGVLDALKMFKDALGSSELGITFGYRALNKVATVIAKVIDEKRNA